MTAYAQHSAGSSLATWGLNAARAVAVLVLIGVLFGVGSQVGAGGLQSTLVTGWQPIALAAGCYALGHLFRIVRLALLVGNARLSLRQLAAFHLFTAGVGLGTPWRLGDLYRAIELGNITGRITTGFTYVWIERLFDAAFLLPVVAILLTFALAGGQADSLSAYGGLIIFTLVFVVVSILLVALLPDNLRRVGTYLIRRHEANWTISALRGIDEMRVVMRGIPHHLRGRMGSLAALSLLIWLFEILGFSMVMPVSQAGMNPVEGLLSFLSQTTTGGFVPQLTGSASGDVVRYLIASRIPLALIAAASAVYYLSASATRPRR